MHCVRWCLTGKNRSFDWILKTLLSSAAVKGRLAQRVDVAMFARLYSIKRLSVGTKASRCPSNHPRLNDVCLSCRQLRECSFTSLRHLRICAWLYFKQRRREISIKFFLQQETAAMRVIFVLSSSFPSLSNLLRAAQEEGKA